MKTRRNKVFRKGKSPLLSPKRKKEVDFKVGKEIKDLKDLKIGKSKENLEKFDRCTLEAAHCGYRTKDGFCLLKDYCRYQLSRKYFENLEENKESTIEYILRVEKKLGRALKRKEILDITPFEEIEIFDYLDRKKEFRRAVFLVDSKGNIMNLVNHRIIRRNFKNKRKEEVNK